MPSWTEFEAAAPQLAERVRAYLDAHTHKTIATFRSASAEPSHLFRLDLQEISTVGLNAERNGLVIEVWTPEQGVRTIRRR